jgi:replicative superfamily II helicase
LLQTLISRSSPKDFALISDLSYVQQNSTRILRALFEIAINRNWGQTSSVILSLANSVEWRVWSFETPLRQFGIGEDIARKIEDLPSTGNIIEEFRAMSGDEIGNLIRNKRMGSKLHRFAKSLPTVELHATASPITRSVLRIEVDIQPTFVWYDLYHGQSEPFWIWIEDSESNEVYQAEYVVINKKNIKTELKLDFLIPIHEPLPAQIYIRAISDKWLGPEMTFPLSFQHLVLPILKTEHTDLLDLQPLPIRALRNPVFESICRRRFEYFNPIQTQVFHTLYETDNNVLLGAPTGSGKTVAAELALW